MFLREKVSLQTRRETLGVFQLTCYDITGGGEKIKPNPAEKRWGAVLWRIFFAAAHPLFSCS